MLIKIQILPNETYSILSEEKPREGDYYFLESATNGTLAQNNLFHAFVDCLFEWMMKTDTYVFEVDGIAYDFRCPNKHVLKMMLKRDFGEGYDYYCYSNDKHEVVFAKSLDEVPDYVIEAYEHGNKHLIKRHLKSWAKYTTKQRQRLIDTLKTLMIIFKVDSKKFEEIMQTLEKEQIC